MGIRLLYNTGYRFEHEIGYIRRIRRITAVLTSPFTTAEVIGIDFDHDNLIMAVNGSWPFI